MTDQLRCLVVVVLLVLDPNRHRCEPSNLGQEGERSQCSDFFGSHAPVEDENEDEHD
jgi:hypothetical protein